MTCPTCTSANPAGATVCTTCGSPLNAAVAGAVATGVAVPFSPSLPCGSRLQGDAFAIGDVLGQGGFGITYKGGDMKLRRHVAIKEFFPYGAHRQGTTVMPPAGITVDDYGQSRQGFVRESLTLARFNHPGIVRVFGAFEENNTAYMVMELLEGQSLQQLLDTRGVLSESDAVRIVTQIGEALTAVHEAKLLHRDIKPDNIILVGAGTPQQRAVLIDFGTAREFAANKTRAMTAMVTHGYAPLEQYGKQAKFGPYTDVYALGATLYHCLVGQLPVSAMDRLSGVDLLPPGQVNPNISRGVSDAVMWSLQIKAQERPQSVAEWTRALQSGIVPRPVTVPPPLPQQPLPLPRTPAPVPPSTPAPGRSRFCPHCGSPMSIYMTICPHCLQRNTAPAAEEKKPWWKDKAVPAGGGQDVSDGSGTPAIIAVLVLVVLLLLGAVKYGQREAARIIPDGDSPGNADTTQIDPATAATPPPAAPALTPPPAPTPAYQATAEDAYDTACEFVSRRLARPSTADFLPYDSKDCDVIAIGSNSWRVESAGSAQTTLGDTIYFTWSATMTYSPSTEMWNGSTSLKLD